MQRYRIAALAAFLGIISISAHAAAPLRHNFNVAPGGTLHVDADVGSIRVTSGSTQGIGVVVERNGSADALKKFEVTYDQSGNDVTIRGRYENVHHWFSFGNDLDVRFVITVPSQFNVDLKTSGGDVEVGDLQGRAVAHTSGGDLTLGHINGSVEAHTSGGNVKLESSQTAVLKTSGGDIRAGDVAAHLEARTSGGSIEVHHAGDVYARSSGGGIVVEQVGGTIDASTSGGSIKVAMARQPSAESHLSTSGGNITLSLASDIKVDIDAHTTGGEVDTDVPVELLGKQSEGRLTGHIHGGGPRLELRTSGGDIRVRRL